MTLYAALYFMALSAGVGLALGMLVGAGMMAKRMRE
jgi:hypothetical protein